MSIFGRPASHSKKYYETEGPPEKCDIKECVKLNEDFMFRSTDKKHTIRQIVVLAIMALIIAGGTVTLGYYLMILFFKLVV